MQARRLEIPGICEIVPEKHGDDRGYFAETFRDDWFRANIADLGFVQENQSFSSAAGTVRGLHFQSEPFAQGKLVRCVKGAVLDVAVDIRQGSPYFGKWIGVELTSEELNQLWIPPGFAHGFCTLSAGSVIAYKVTAYYSRANDLGIACDDPDIGVKWPEIADFGTLSAKDHDAPAMADIPEYFRFQG